MNGVRDGDNTKGLGAGEDEGCGLGGGKKRLTGKWRRLDRALGNDNGSAIGGFGAAGKFCRRSEKCSERGGRYRSTIKSRYSAKGGNAADISAFIENGKPTEIPEENVADVRTCLYVTRIATKNNTIIRDGNPAGITAEEPTYINSAIVKGWEFEYTAGITSGDAAEITARENASKIVIGQSQKRQNSDDGAYDGNSCKICWHGNWEKKWREASASRPTLLFHVGDKEHRCDPVLIVANQIQELAHARIAVFPALVAGDELAGTG